MLVGRVNVLRMMMGVCGDVHGISLGNGAVARTRVAATEPVLMAVEGSTPSRGWSDAFGGKRRATGIKAPLGR